jgi:hypothetical protein
MGMDVIGRRPSSPAGNCFLANIWSWGAIHALICDLCSDLLDEKTLQGIGFNDGAGVADQRTCTEMANRFGLWMEHHVQGARVTKDGTFITEDDLEENPDLKTPYHVEDNLLKEWVDFLRHCGGFEVW